MGTLFKNAIKLAKFRFYNFQLRDYRNYYETMNILPYWDTSNRKMFDQKYLSIAASKRMLYKLLIFQTNGPISMEDLEKGIVKEDYNWKPKFYEYARDLILFIDKKRGKLNTDMIISPPCVGKTLFMDLIRDYLINCGQMSNWNRNSNFPLQTCGYTRVIFWNEPNYESSVESNLLKLLGGDSLNAAIKNQMDVNIEKTPIFVTSNKDPFPHSPEFNYRIKRYTWRTAPFLKSVAGKNFHPLVMQYLISETENYYKDDITMFQEKYTNNENNILRTLNVYDYSNVSSSESASETANSNEESTSDIEL